MADHKDPKQEQLHFRRHGCWIACTGWRGTLPEKTLHRAHGDPIEAPFWIKRIGSPRSNLVDYSGPFPEMTLTVQLVCLAGPGQKATGDAGIPKCTNFDELN